MDPVPGPRAHPGHNDLNDVLATLPLVVGAAVLVWLAFVRGGLEMDVQGPLETTVEAAASPSAPPRVPADPPVVSPDPSFLHIVVFPPERVAEVTALLAAESVLRAALGESARQADVIDAADAAEAKQIASFILSYFGSLPGVRLNAIVLR